MVNVVAGPAFGGKSQLVRSVMHSDDVMIDTQDLRRAMYPADDYAEPMTEDQVSAVQRAKASLARQFAGADTTAWLTVATGARSYLSRWMERAGASSLYVVDDVTREQAIARAAEKYGGEAPDQCVGVIDRWFDSYERDEAVDRSFAGAFACNSGGGGTCRFYSAADDMELQADHDARIVAGVAVKYGAIGYHGGMESRYRFRVKAGALRVRMEADGRPWPMTQFHDHAQPVGTPEYTDSPEALRFRLPISAGARGDQCLADIRDGNIRGASMELAFDEDGISRCNGMSDITGAEVVRTSLVDIPAFRSSVIRVHGAVDPIPVNPKPPRLNWANH